MKESQIEGYLRLAVIRLGGLAYKFVSPGRSGVPDRLVILPGGKAHFVELKAPGKKPDIHQKREFFALSRMGFPVTVLDSKMAVDQWLKEVKKDA